MKSYYARHSSKLDISTEFKARLYEENKIFIHYPHHPGQDRKFNDGQADNASLDSVNYPKQDGYVVNRLNTLALNGGYVFADYGTELPYKVGIVTPKSSVTLERGVWGDKNNLAGREAVVKALQLTNIQTLTPEQAVLFKLGRPQQGTLCQWRTIGKRLKFRLSGKPADFNLSYLTPDQQEVMCGEFFRSELPGQFDLPRISTYLTPIGRTMADVDIYGLTATGKNVFVQVTHAGVIKQKIEKLKHLTQSPDNHVIYISRAVDPKPQPGITFFSLDKIYDTFCLNHHAGKQWLAAIK
jgi:hypothetical protein